MVTPQEVIAIAQQKGLTNQEIQSAIQQGQGGGMGQTQSPQTQQFFPQTQQPAPGMGNNQTMQALQAVLGQKRNPWLAGAESFTRSLSKSMGGSPPEAQTDLTDALRKTMGQEQIKQLFQDPLEKRKLQADVTQKEAIADILTDGGVGSISTDPYGNTIITPSQKESGLQQTAEAIKTFEKENPGFTLTEEIVAGPGGTKSRQLKVKRVDEGGVSETQKKAINEITATRGTVDRITRTVQNVPDLGGVNFSGAGGMLGKIGSGLIGMFPRGTEGRLREGISKNLTAGEGSGLSGLNKEQDENLRTYIGGLPTQGGELYKALSGDTGRLSDYDIERGMNLSWRPDLGETTGIRDKKARVLKEAVVEREEAIRNGQFTVDPETGAILTPQVLNNAIAKLGGIQPQSQEALSSGIDVGDGFTLRKK